VNAKKQNHTEYPPLFFQHLSDLATGTVIPASSFISLGLTACKYLCYQHSISDHILLDRMRFENQKTTVLTGVYIHRNFYYYRPV
jgi:hypothetical protein